MYYLYKHIDLEGNTFYIGKSTKDIYHKNGNQRAFSRQGRTDKWRDIANKGYTVEILEEFNNETDCLSEELLLIQECKNCINKTSRYTSFEYKIQKLNENVAILKFSTFSENQYILLREGKIYKSCGKEINGTDNGKGYTIIGFAIKNAKKWVTKNLYLHRLIAEAFVDNTDLSEKKIVNHLDTNKKNNRAENLEWCTQKENVNHSIQLKNKKYGTNI